MWGAHSHERAGLSFTITAGLHQRSHSVVQIPRDSWPHFTVSDSRLPQPGRPAPRIYTLQEQDGLVITPSRHWVLLSSPPTLAGLRWRYSNPPPRGLNSGTRFEFQPGHWLSWLRFFVVFFSLSRQTTGQCLDCAMIAPFKSFLIHHSFIIKQYIVSTPKWSLNNSIEKKRRSLQ
jgi:hypothetical protein